MPPAIGSVATRAARRLTLNAAAARAVRLGLYASAVGFVLACIARFGGFADWPWGWIAAVLAASVMIAVVYGWRFDRVPVAGGGLVLDERLSLHDALSTAINLDGQPGTLAEAQRAAATQIASGVSGEVGRAVPLQMPQGWWVVLVLIAAATGVAAMPPLFGRDAEPAAMDLTQASLETDAAIAEMQAVLDASPELLAHLGPDPLLTAVEQPEDAEQLRQDTLQSLTELQQALDAFAIDPSQQRLEGLRGRLEDFEQEPGDLGEQARRALAAGDFERAADAMEAMQTSGGEDQADALDSLADDLAAAAAGDEQVRDAMKDAGVVPEDGQSLTDAVEAAEHLDDASRESLADLIERDKGARSSLKEMAKDCEQAASECRNPGEPGSPNAKQSECRKIAEDQKASKQAAACKSACAAGRTRVGEGLGGSPMNAADDSPDVAKAVKAASEVDTTAPVTSISPAAGPLRLGDVTDAGGAAMAAAQRRVQRGIDVQRIPKRYREAVAAWFKQARSEDPSGKDEGQDEPEKQVEEPDTP